MRLLLTIYKDLDWERLSDLIDKFYMDYNRGKPCVIGGVKIYSDRVDVFPEYIVFHNEMEYYSYTYEDYDFYSQEVARIEFDDTQKFDLVVDWEWFEIKLK